MLGRLVAMSVMLALPVTGCGRTQDPNVTVSAMSFQTVGWRAAPQSGAWTQAALDALEAHGAPLVGFSPTDIDAWCPAYDDGDDATRKAFWVGFLSALSRHESTWNPKAVGGGGRWFGLLQIAPSTARGYGCRATSGKALKNGAENLSCAVRIMAHTVVRDGVVAEGMRGVAADWGPLHSERKRTDMMARTRALPACGAG
ncbi:transglycosylase SLT domain-containing protein [Aliiroseovarius sp. PTFE2010]|uniref:transglycosylase SLT domain-containing protein n=1 Tax=Aliiroseovarius sp. PTFE2010 TaxID=3417190 RepID=UPI003CF3FAB6